MSAITELENDDQARVVRQTGSGHGDLPRRPEGVIREEEKETKGRAVRAQADMRQGLSDGAAAYVAEATIAWDQARREASRLRGERASFRCEHESNAEYDERGQCTEEAHPACWRSSWQDQLGRDCYLPVADWCCPCRQRQAVHEAYTKAVAHRQGLMRGLQRRALAAWESSRPAAAVDPYVGDSSGRPRATKGTT